ncbi:hypothetical protein Poli38472_014039 [Pythium oligandrum]|uniref:Enoyl-CoA hydratase n=1 Tax=Pythium oligandrum TaxID=41045 RepID=A0A8K1CNB9_PYTOL|nr:hypothetical protein Poli38472_014039 [Pythium oligandrum]|eukprot:TMW66727.1 hypothetical protein Poli38472_014039 [Pythium oligandrum]
MTTDVVVRRYVHAKHIYVAELHRPRRMNAVSQLVYQQLIQAIEEYEANDELHALVITGHGKYFTSGADLSEGMSMDEKGNQILPSKNWACKFMDAMVKCPKVLVAAVNGPAIGIGTTLLLHCDFVYAVETAFFWTPFMRIGIVPEFAASYTFPRVLGRQLANEMLMMSRRVDTKRALAHGLVTQVYPVDGFLTKVFEDLAPMVNTPLTAQSLPLYKSMLRREDEARVREAIYHEFVELDRLFLSGAPLKAINAFLSAQKPKL